MNPNHPHRGCFFGLIFCALLLAAPGRALAANPSVLIVSGGPHDIDFAVMQKLAGAGLQMDYLNSRTELTWDRIKRYNALVFFDLCPYASTDPTGDLAKSLALIDRFMQQGGGVFLIPNLDWWGDSAPLMRAMQKDLFPHYGAHYLFEQWIQDPRVATAGIWPRNKYAYTSNFTPHPVTDEVSGIWYPVDQSGRAIPSTTPIAVDTNWTVVVRSAPTAWSTNALAAGVTAQNLSVYPAEIQALTGFEKAPALLAVRALGKGRLAFLAMNQTFHLTGGLSRGLDGTMMEGKGLQSVPNDIFKLFANTLRWLAEPSSQSGALGGYVQDASRLQEYRPPLVPLSAQQLETFPAELPSFKGLIGAQSKLSTGQAAPEELIAAARQGGLQYLVFLEEFTALTPAKLEQLKKVCAAASDATFQAIPGFQIDDNRHHRQFFFGHEVVWPEPAYLTADGKAFDVAARPDVSGIPHIGFMVSYAQEKNALGYFHFQPHRDSAPMTDLRLYNSVGLVYYHAGQQREGLAENFRDFLETNDQGCNPLPFSIDVVTNADQLRAALTTGHFLTYAVADKVENVMRALRYSYLVSPRAYVSQGPVIRDWTGINRDYETVGQNFLTLHYRWPVRCRITSDVGLAEVRIWDGPELFRRYVLHGEKDFQRVFQFTHNQQKNLVLEVTDVQGHKAISAEQFDRNQIHYRYWCSDRENAGSWFTHGPYYYGVATEDGPSFLGKGLDSSIGSLNPPFGMHPLLQSDRGTEGDRSFNNHPYQLLTSEDAGLTRNVCAKKYPATEKLYFVWGTYGPLIDTELFTFQQEKIDYRTGYLYWPLKETPDDPDHPWVTPSLFTTTVTFKQDLTVQDLQVMGFSFPMAMFQLPGNEPLMAVAHTKEDVTVCGPYWSNFFTTSPGGPYTIVRNGFLALFSTKPTGAGVLYNLDNPLRLDVNMPAGTRLLADLDGQRVRKGDTYTCRFLTLGGRTVEKNTVQRYEEIRKFLGLTDSGRPGYELNLRRGKVLSTRGLLDLQTKNGAVDLSIPSPPKDRQLHVILGLRIYGLNSRWDAGLYDRAQKKYRPIGTHENIGYARLNPETGESAAVVIGHPVTASNPNVFITFTPLNDKPHQYYCAVNNPTDKPVTVTLTQQMDLPGLKLDRQRLTIPAGGEVVVLQDQP